MPASPKAPITALVVCYNEADLLARCLTSLAFCAEIIVVDLGSIDNSVAIAQAHGGHVVRHDWVPIGEMARPAGAKLASHDWLLIIDPDEEVTASLAADIITAVSTAASNIGVMSVPWFNYFKKHPLRGTVWGGYHRRKRVLVHRQRAKLITQVHSDFFKLKSGNVQLDIPATGHNWLRHYWIRSWGAFGEKHRRYLKLEGEARYRRGERFRLRRLVKAVPFYFWESFIYKQGYRDGPLGMLLSILWVWYNFMSLLSLRNYQKGITRG